MQRGQPRIARGDAVVALGLQEREEATHVLGRKSVEIEILKAAAAVSRYESQKQDQGVAIASKGVHTHTAKRRQILAEELLDTQAKVVGARALHDAPPLIR